MAKTITVKAAKDALTNLKKLKPANEKYDDALEMSVKEAVFLMATDLVQLARRGFTSKELSAGLAADGLHIKPGTLNRYLNEYLTAKQRVEKSEAVSKNNETDDEKAEDQGSESSGSVSPPKAPNEAGDQPPSSQVLKNDIQRLENQSAATPNNKEGRDFENPKPALANTNPGPPPSTGKAEWARAAESALASKTI